MSIVHQYRGIDIVDAVLSPLFVASSLATTGIATISILGFGFSDALFSGSGTTLTVGWVLGFLALAGAYGTNQVDFQEFDEIETAVVLGMVFVHVGVALVPIVRDVVLSSQLVAIPIVVVQAAGYYLIAYY